MHRIYGTVIVALGLFLITACGVQKAALTEDQVPSAVKQTFHEKFPAVQNPGWSLKSDQNYEAEFAVQQVEMAVKIDPAGKWLETETAIPPATLPPAVQNTMAAQFKDYQLIETQTLLRAGAARSNYELHLDNGKQVVKAEFSPEGALLTQSAKPKP